MKKKKKKIPAKMPSSGHSLHQEVHVHVAPGGADDSNEADKALRKLKSQWPSK